MIPIRVLVGEQICLLRDGIRVALKDTADLELVAETDDGRTLVKLATEYAPDVVIADSDMASISVQELIRCVKEVSPHSSIVILSNTMDTYHLMLSLNAGAKGYLARDVVSAEQIKHTIRCVYKGEVVIYLADSQDMANIPVDSATFLTPHQINKRELEVLNLAARGLSNKTIAEQLFLSERTVHSHFCSIFRKISAKSRTEAIYCALKNGWINLD